MMSIFTGITIVNVLFLFTIVRLFYEVCSPRQRKSPQHTLRPSSSSLLLLPVARIIIFIYY